MTGSSGEGDLAAARRALDALGTAGADAALGRDLAAAIEVAERTARAVVDGTEEALTELTRAARVVARGPAGPCAPEVGRALVAEVEAASPEVALAVGIHAALPYEDLEPLLLRMLLARAVAARGSAIEAALDVVHAAGPGAFPAHERGSADIFEGFAWLRAGYPGRAARAFQEALEHGGDEIEALRGALLAAVAEGAGGQGGGRRIGAAGDRLAAALQRCPGGGALAAAASTLAAQAWLRAGEARAALASVDAARAGARGALREELDGIEAQARALGGGGARASGEERAPFEGATPGVTSAGELAAELERAIRSGSAGGLSRRGAGSLAEGMPAAALACQEALGREERLAFDAAALALSFLYGHAPEAARACFVAHVARWAADPAAVRRLAAMALLLEGDEALLAAAAGLATGAVEAPPGAVGAALLALGEAAIAADDELLARDILVIARPRLGPRWRAVFEALVDPDDPAPVEAEDPVAALRALDRLLQPRFSLVDLLDAIPRASGAVRRARAASPARAPARRRDAGEERAS